MSKYRWRLEVTDRLAAGREGRYRWRREGAMLVSSLDDSKVLDLLERDKVGGGGRGRLVARKRDGSVSQQWDLEFA